MLHATALQRALLDWFEADARDLPWRKTSDPYRIWLSEVILQQTRVDQGLPYYERFIEAFPTVEALASAHEDAVLKRWEGLGYYTRARNLHKAARAIVEDHHGALPRDPQVLQLLPGVGRYTAGAIASIAFGVRAPVVDGNVKRVLARLYDIAESIDEPATDRALWELAGRLVPAKRPGDFNQAMMELGARICVPRNPDCGACPAAKYCQARRAGTQAERPMRSTKKAVPHKEIVVAVIEKDGLFLLGKRPTTGLLGGLWEFPGGKVEHGESHAEALLRECKEELGVKVQPGGLVACVKHAYTHLHVTLNVYRCRLASGKPRPKTHTELRWVAAADFDDFAFPKANHKFLKLLKNSAEIDQNFLDLG